MGGSGWVGSLPGQIVGSSLPLSKTCIIRDCPVNSGLTSLFVKKKSIIEKLEKWNFHNLSPIGVLIEMDVTMRRASKNDAECNG